MEAQEDESFPSQPKSVYDLSKEVHLFTKEEGTADCCQVAALSLENQWKSDWLEGFTASK